MSFLNETPERARIFVVDDDPTVQLLLGQALGGAFAVTTFERGEPALDALDALHPRAVVLDLGLPDTDGLEVLRRIQKKRPGLPVIILTGDAKTEQVVAAMQAGAWDYHTKPVAPAALRHALEDAVSLRTMQVQVEGASPEDTSAGLIGRSPLVSALREEIALVAPTGVSVCVFGESGTGKERVCQMIHALSPVGDGPLVAINCAAVPASLQEAELFGFAKGAFTGAMRSFPGRIREASGGTLFLDEVAELAPDLQTKLLRVIQERVVRPVGALDEVPVDFRLVCATNEDLEERVAQGLFREDLYYRINVYSLTVPPLRARREDIPLLAARFLATHGPRICGTVPGLSREAAEALEALPWPGNVRQLQNVIQRAMVLSGGARILPQHLDVESLAAEAELLDPSAPKPRRRRADRLNLVVEGGRPLQEIVQDVVRQVVERFDGNRSQAARSLGISRTTLYRYLDRDEA